ncbi:MAG: rRNA maturation RNase YbeY [Treponemataceae bacterium]|nr:rRNA maturation RNase YbeY [Treponemataceae bacterium]
MRNKILVDFEEGMDPPAWIDKVAPFADKVLEKLDKNDWEVSFFFCSLPFIQRLNKEYRSIDSATDILSFEEGSEYQDEEGKTVFAAGDIAICIDVFVKNALEFGVSADEELKRLIIHGLMHLSGMDHGEAHIGKDRTFEGGSEEDRKMLVLQEDFVEYFASESLIDSK